MLSKSSPSPPGRPDRKGQIFNLPLPTLVSGRDATGRVFQERTVLFYISDHGASFNLSNLVALGAKLKLNIDLPPTLAENKNLKLVINGRVALIEAHESSPTRQRVSLRFESRYIIQADEGH
jgi:hypothetical protein